MFKFVYHFIPTPSCSDIVLIYDVMRTDMNFTLGHTDLIICFSDSMGHVFQNQRKKILWSRD